MMRKLTLSLCLAALPMVLLAEPVSDSIGQHIQPGYVALMDTTLALKTSAETCDAPALRDAYHTAFDDWIAVSHLRFGPSETDDRAFSLAFWPDKKNFTGKSIDKLVQAKDAIVGDPTDFHEVSIAARGFYALDRLLFAPQDDLTPYECALVTAITNDIWIAATAISDDWMTSYSDVMLSGGADENTTYLSAQEPVQELYKALSSGLEFIAEVRLGRPLGTFERARPKRADARRSGRSLRHIEVSLTAMKPFALILAQDVDPAISTHLAESFDRTVDVANKLDDPVFAGVSTPTGRLKVEILQIEVRRILTVLELELGPALGITPGFNALDGD